MKERARTLMEVFFDLLAVLPLDLSKVISLLQYFLIALSIQSLTQTLSM